MLGVVGEVDPETLRHYELAHARAGWLELDLSKLAAAPTALARGASREPLPLERCRPRLRRAGLGACGRDRGALRRAAGELGESVELFDVYRGAGVSEGSRSLAYRLRLCAQDRTLTDGEIAEVRAQAIRAVESQFGATLRS